MAHTEPVITPESDQKRVYIGTYHHTDIYVGESVQAMLGNGNVYVPLYSEAF